MSLYRIDNSNILVTKEKTALIPINFNDFKDCDTLINSLKNHDGKLQESIVTMLRCMDATNTHTLDLSLKKIILSVNEIQSSSNAISYNNELKQKLEFSLNKEKVLSSEKDELLQKIDLLTKEKDVANKRILELEEQLSSNTQKQEHDEQLSASGSNIDDNENSIAQLKEQEILSSNSELESDPNLSDPNEIDSIDDSMNTESDESSNFINSNSHILTDQNNADYDEEPTDFNNLVHSAKFPREAQSDYSNISPEIINEHKEKENLEAMRNRLYGNDDPYSYQDNEQDKKIDEILENALNNLEANEALDLDALYDENAKDAQLAEALKIYENLDKETYPELYEIDKNSLLQALERKLSNRLYENRINRSLSHHRPIKPSHTPKPNNSVSSENGSIDENKSNTESNNNLPNSSMVFNEGEIKTIDPAQVKTNNDTYADTDDELFNALDDFESKTEDSEEKADQTETDSNTKSEDTTQINADDMKSNNNVPSVLQSSDPSDAEKECEIKQEPEKGSEPSQVSSEFNGFSSLLPKNKNIENTSTEEKSSNEESESDDDLFTIEVPNEFLTTKEKIQKYILKKSFYIEITRKQFNDYNNLNINDSIKNAVAFMRQNNWINQEV